MDVNRTKEAQVRQIMEQTVPRVPPQVYGEAVRRGARMLHRRTAARRLLWLLLLAAAMAFIVCVLTVQPWADPPSDTTPPWTDDSTAALAGGGGDAAYRAARGAGARGDGLAGGLADRHGAPDRRPRREEGDQRADQRLQAGVGQGEHPVRHRRGVTGRAGRRGPRGGLSRGARWSRP